MGNNLAAIAPNQILPVEQYLQGHVFDIQSLGSTRFMKVVRAKTALNASVVAKVRYFICITSIVVPSLHCSIPWNGILCKRLISNIVN